MEVKEPNVTNWKKMARMITYFNGKNKKYIPLSGDYLKGVKYMWTHFF